MSEQLGLCRIGPYNVVNVTLSDCVALSLDAISARKRTFFACLNPHSFVVGDVDRRFQSALQSSELLVADGVGVVVAARVLGCSRLERVTGPEFFLALSNAMNASEIRRSVYFLGSSEFVLDAIIKRFGEDFPNVRIAGCYSPPFIDNFDMTENEKILDLISTANPDVLWVGLSAPKQEKWIVSHREAIRATFVGAIGAAFDFYAGSVPRAPLILRRLGLEWLYRLAVEPARLWRRVFVSGPIFLFRVVCLAISRDKA